MILDYDWKARAFRPTDGDEVRAKEEALGPQQPYKGVPRNIETVFREYARDQGWVLHTKNLEGKDVDLTVFSGNAKRLFNEVKLKDGTTYRVALALLSDWYHSHETEEARLEVERQLADLYREVYPSFDWEKGSRNVKIAPERTTHMKTFSFPGYLRSHIDDPGMFKVVHIDLDQLEIVGGGAIIRVGWHLESSSVVVHPRLQGLRKKGIVSGTPLIDQFLAPIMVVEGMYYLVASGVRTHHLASQRVSFRSGGIYVGNPRHFAIFDGRAPSVDFHEREGRDLFEFEYSISHGKPAKAVKRAMRSRLHTYHLTEDTTAFVESLLAQPNYPKFPLVAIAHPAGLAVSGQIATARAEAQRWPVEAVCTISGAGHYSLEWQFTVKELGSDAVVHVEFTPWTGWMGIRLSPEASKVFGAYPGAFHAIVTQATAMGKAGDLYNGTDPTEYLDDFHARGLSELGGSPVTSVGLELSAELASNATLIPLLQYELGFVLSGLRLMSEADGTDTLIFTRLIVPPEMLDFKWEVGEDRYGPYLSMHSPCGVMPKLDPRAAKFLDRVLRIGSTSWEDQPLSQPLKRKVQLRRSSHNMAQIRAKPRITT